MSFFMKRNQRSRNQLSYAKVRERCDESPKIKELLKSYMPIRGAGLIFDIKQFLCKPALSHLVSSLLKMAGNQDFTSHQIDRFSELKKDKILTKTFIDKCDLISEEFIISAIDNMKSDDAIKERLKKLRVQGKTFIEKVLEKMKAIRNKKDVDEKNSSIEIEDESNNEKEFLQNDLIEFNFFEDEKNGQEEFNFFEDGQNNLIETNHFEDGQNRQEEFKSVEDEQNSQVEFMYFEDEQNNQNEIYFFEDGQNSQNEFIYVDDKQDSSIEFSFENEQNGFDSNENK